MSLEARRPDQRDHKPHHLAVMAPDGRRETLEKSGIGILEAPNLADRSAIL
eukprot:CAMPEP_0184293876 /NCGR_PEP_ID=MMETSP1049-20130417/5196_1 /TAXON_ID=77928 /ORGANISM="Proteomonas sulcata, Strain CCMP704" /LENGTH=50 /DNA_ID=CAMNT_0026601971 /DNA_START=51 /DNA_END=203 /DNA_ORIENTATION=+